MTVSKSIDNGISFTAIGMVTRLAKFFKAMDKSEFSTHLHHA